MAVDLLDMIKQGLPGHLPDVASKLLGESPGSTQTAVSAALPVLLAGIAQTGSTTGGAQSVLTMLDDPAVNTSAPGTLSSLPAEGPQSTSLMSAGADLLNSLLGDKFGALAGSLASIAGLRSSRSATNLLGLLAPIVLASIKKLVDEKGLGASGLASVLADQGRFLQGALDKRLTSALGFASPSALLDSLGGKAAAAMAAAGATIGSAGTAAASTAIGSPGAAAASTAQRADAYAGEAAAEAARTAPRWMRWLAWAIAAIVALFLLSRLSTCTQTTGNSATAPAATPPVSTATQNPAAWPSRRGSDAAT